MDKPSDAPMMMAPGATSGAAEVRLPGRGERRKRRPPARDEQAGEWPAIDDYLGDHPLGARRRLYFGPSRALPVLLLLKRSSIFLCRSALAELAAEAERRDPPQRPVPGPALRPGKWRCGSDGGRKTCSGGRSPPEAGGIPPDGSGYCGGTQSSRWAYCLGWSVEVSRCGKRE